MTIFFKLLVLSLCMLAAGITYIICPLRARRYRHVLCWLAGCTVMATVLLVLMLIHSARTGVLP